MDVSRKESKLDLISRELAGSHKILSAMVDFYESRRY